MNFTLVDKVARALLYEGYLLYPYRPSVKNAQRWTFGGVYPKDWSDAQKGTDPFAMQTECLVHRETGTKVRVNIRFLHLIERTVGRLPKPLADWPKEGEPSFDAVETMEIGDKRYQGWQEAAEQTVDLGEVDLNQPLRKALNFPASRRIEPLRSADEMIVGVLVRRQQALAGEVELSAVTVAENLLRIRVRIVNQTPLANASQRSRDDALMRSFVSTHTILGVQNGEFVSLLDPPPQWAAAAEECRNIGTWPVLVGENGQRDILLSSPIILYDYPQVSPESPGDLFDATEIDEILTLRILTLSDEEKRAVAAVDQHAGDLLSRTESLARDQLMNLHGTMRGLRPVEAEQSHG